jgi:hypothetical protein
MTQIVHAARSTTTASTMFLVVSTRRAQPTLK